MARRRPPRRPPPLGLIALGSLTAALWFSGWIPAFSAPNGLQPMALVFTGLAAFAGLAWGLVRARRRLLFRQAQDLAALHRMGWADFERLVGEAYRRHGWSVEENGLGGADGGVDLFLRRGGRRGLVQVKHWKAKVGAPIVREQFGLMHHHRAHEVHVVALGGFTPQAEAFAQGKPICLLDGPGLLKMMGGTRPDLALEAPAVATPPSGTRPSRPAPTTPKAPACPQCQSAMAHRTRRSDGSLFWGCVRYPLCQGTRSITVR